MRIRPFVIGCAVVAFFAAVASPAGAASRLGPLVTCDGQWHKVRTVDPARNGGDYNSLVAISARTKTDAWAAGIGDDFDSPTPGYRTLIEHWDGSAWSLVPSPNSPLYTWNQLSGISADAANDAWAVGILNTSPYYSLILHWDGTSWSIQDAGTPDTYLTSVVALSPTDVWAAGSTNYVGEGLILHWDGSTWNRTVMPQAINFRAITVLASTDIWAVGQESTAQYLDLTVAMHFDGTNWTQYPTPSPLKIHSEDENWLTSVSGVASNDVWATGVSRDHDWGIVDHPFTVHWDGTKWSLVSTPDPGGAAADTDLEGLVALGSNDVWAVGSVGNEPDWSTFSVHWDGSAWTQSSSSTGGRFVAAAADTAGGIWGVGDRSVTHPFIGTATLAQHMC